MTDNNTGDGNTGNLNTGHRNAGASNTGNWNTGDWNTGNWNAGDWNAGARNTGDWNAGARNTGNLNTGHRNAGDRNTGDWNTGNRNTGYFNTTTPDTINCFNAPTDREAWQKAHKPNWIFSPSHTTWVGISDMTDNEKAANPNHKTNGGYLRTNDMAEEWRKAYESAPPEDVQAVRDLPNFNADVFKEITGLDLGVKPKGVVAIEIDGKLYSLTEIARGQEEG